MRYTFQLIPQGVIPRDPDLTFQVQDLAAVAAETESVCMLTQKQVGFGSATDELSGSAKLTWDDVAETMTIGSASGGAIITGADAAAGSDSSGGYLELHGGAGDTGGTGADVGLYGGTGGETGDGGVASVNGGRGGATSGSGGPVNITGGEAMASGNGGGVNINGGAGAGGGDGGTITLQVSAGGFITLAGIPTSAAGLPGGALWNDAGTIKIA